MLKALPLARALVSRGCRRAATTQAAALSSRSFHVSAAAFAPKEITVRDAINSALASRTAPVTRRASRAGAPPPNVCMRAGACMRVRAYAGMGPRPRRLRGPVPTGLPASRGPVPAGWLELPTCALNAAPLLGFMCRMRSCRVIKRSTSWARKSVITRGE
jgi:hypothetical protein